MPRRHSERRSCCNYWEVGYPVMIKATAGGGGKGMRIAWDDEEIKEAFRICSSEAMSSFGDGRMFIEKFIEQPRHIEIQVLGDKHGNIVYLPERECSIQRRNQKVIEEAPSTFLTQETRKSMGEQAVRLARAVGYYSAGTVECLVDRHKNFYFLEMNTRLQVEHAVTECITGLDLVEIMFRVAAGERLLLTQEEAVQWHGWSIESRIYAEHPARHFLPSNGRLKRYIEPGPKNDKEVVRIDSGVEEGSQISLFYDPMISKLITWGGSRAEALKSMERALDGYIVDGVTQNIPFLRSIVSHKDFVAGNISTKFIESQFPNGWNDDHLDKRDMEQLVAISVAIHFGSMVRFSHPSFLVESEPLDLVVKIGDSDTNVQVTRKHGTHQNLSGSFSLSLKIGSKQVEVCTTHPPPGNLGLAEIEVDGEALVCQVVKKLPRGFQALFKGATREILVRSVFEHDLEKYMPKIQHEDFTKVLRSPMPGALISIAVKKGQQVAPGDELAVVEAMKMRNVLRAEIAGKVKKLHGKPGNTLMEDEVILDFE